LGTLLIAWRYVVRREHADDFLAAYRPDGAWARLFRQSADYLGTDLLQAVADATTYMTIDRWASAAARRDFLAAHAADYAALDARCAAFTSSETLVGEFVPEAAPRAD